MTEKEQRLKDQKITDEQPKLSDEKLKNEKKQRLKDQQITDKKLKNAELPRRQGGTHKKQVQVLDTTS